MRGFFLKEGQHQLVYIPSLDMSAYGDTVEQAEEMLKVSLVEFAEDLQTQSRKQQEKILRDMGWKNQIGHNKNFEAPYVDQNGILQKFDLDPHETEIQGPKELTISI